MDIEILTPGPVAAIGEALSGRLKRAFPVKQFEHQFVPANLDGAMWTRLLRRTPFVGLGFVGLDPLRESGKIFDGSSEWVLFLVTSNERGPKERFFGDTLAPGALQMMQVAVGVLQGFNIQGLGSVGVGKVSNSFAEEWKDGALAMIQIGLTVRTAFALSDVVQDIPADDLDQSGITWSFDGGKTIALTELNEVNT